MLSSSRVTASSCALVAPFCLASAAATVEAAAVAGSAAGAAAASSGSLLPWALAAGGLSVLVLLLGLTVAAYLLLLRPQAVAPVPPASIAGESGPIPKTRATPHATYDTDVVIVGAGCAGAAIGAALGKRGYRCVVLERDLREPERIVGELLQPSGCALLRQMGLPGQSTGAHAHTPHTHTQHCSLRDQSNKRSWTPC